MWSYFNYKNITYNLRKEAILYLPSTNSTYYGTNSVHSRGSLIWNNLLSVLNLANEYLNLKPKLRTLEVLIGDV